MHLASHVVVTSPLGSTAEEGLWPAVARDDRGLLRIAAAHLAGVDVRDLDDEGPLALRASQGRGSDGVVAAVEVQVGNPVRDVLGALDVLVEGALADVDLLGRLVPEGDPPLAVARKRAWNGVDRRNRATRARLRRRLRLPDRAEHEEAEKERLFHDLNPYVMSKLYAFCKPLWSPGASSRQVQ